MIIFETILSTFESSIIYEAAGPILKKSARAKNQPTISNYGLLKSVIHSVIYSKFCFQSGSKSFSDCTIEIPNDDPDKVGSDND